ncbi:H/ACA ribonucleoprotein complex non-core subunit NAF1-like [Salvia splendens]|uniref:H/ACA ribonucleoprotein complex non-core subunit NAF1-like n=1 Tax=Salvia splendens TaxID=180675 RepID=UPI001C266B73|nr:H/ACA ribonucleoprotein complex non-core subunit NAF1-like [Salvia splendens]XP_042060721.1 H/ACA ribonucleoprotein complex non-core subunit NAF1-like [Salvia splendens]XP_042060722.1 H/ACA ribonucleoprotein complex non-core subunit NAF1-like [Salvia splendens]XP_042060723.1 H/ACA ribonucleoprotein complex non-core subunit NAF1-like [Salvia splendens]
MEGAGVNMPDLGEEVVDFESIRGQLVDGRKEFDVLGKALEGSTVKAEPLCGLELEDGEIEGDVEECVEKCSDRNLGDLGCLVEEQLGKVSLDGAAEKNLCVLQVVASLNHENSGVEEAVTEDSSKSVEVGIGTCDGMKSDGDVVVLGDNKNKVDESVDDGDGSENESEDEDESSSDSSSSSSSSSSSEDDDDGENTGKNGEGSGDEETEMEDGEIMLSDLEEMVSWSDVEDEDGGGAGGGPIESKNELKDLPPVPCVDVTLEPHHQTIPVGTVLSMIGAQVIVEGVEKHNPLNEGSILWITDSRSPLGIVDEIFGPVKNPYYIVRYDSEEEVPTGIQQGTLISFVAEFADHVLNNKNLYQKGYDASNENDEELSEDAEFSDDEKEAEFKRMMKMKKRGTNDSKPGNKRKEKRQQNNQKGNGSWNNKRDSTAQTHPGGENQHFARVGTPLNQDSHHQGSSGYEQGFGDQGAISPLFQQSPQAPAFPAPTGSWNNGFPQHQQLNANLLAGLPPNGMLWMQQNLPYLFPAGAPFQQQIGMITGMPPNFNPMVGLQNIGRMIPHWCMDQNASQFGMQGQQGPPPPQFGVQGQQGPPPPQFGVQGQQGPPQPLNGGGDQAVQSQGSQDSLGLQPPPPSMSFNGRRGGGRRHHRGRGRNGGGRGRGRHS